MIQRISTANVKLYRNKKHTSRTNEHNNKVAQVFNSKQYNYVPTSYSLPIVNSKFINFKGYYGDKQPLKKLFWISTNRNDIYEDNWTKEHIYQVGNKKWVNAHPSELLKRSTEQVIQSPFEYLYPASQPLHLPVVTTHPVESQTLGHDEQLPVPPVE